MKYICFESNIIYLMFLKENFKLISAMTCFITGACLEAYTYINSKKIYGKAETNEYNYIDENDETDKTINEEENVNDEEQKDYYYSTNEERILRTKSTGIGWGVLVAYLILKIK